jgi:ATPase subunit of ABC transporter with duplicated ATPase domains
LVALTIGAGCGGGEDSSSTSAAEVRQAQVEAQAEASAEVKAHNEEVREEYQERRQTEAPSPEETEAEQAAADFYEVLGEDKAAKDPNRTTIDTTSFCELMSEEAIAQTIHYAKVSSGIQKQWDCESAVELLVIRSKRTGGFRGAQQAKVIGVNTQGDTATATVQFGSGPATAIPLVKENGEWKLAAGSIEGGR